jgi:hypothetical protein
VNAYAKVTSIAGSVLSLSNVNESFDSFEDGEQFILIQMQDASISGSTNNDGTFGMLSAILTCGNYEIVTLESHTELSGIPNTLTLTGGLSKSYNPSASLQIVSFPTLGGAIYSTTSTMSALPWNGSVGGIIAFRVNGKLEMHHSIEANAKGFRGGLKSGNDGSACINSMFATPVSAAHASKGEGIFSEVYGNTLHPYSAGRAPLINGGGGGSVHNAGGGGGAHISHGGNGGDGWSCTPGSGGMGAYSLAAYANVNRIFMGGGGGGGQENNNQGTSGAAGGGIVLIQADSIIVDACGVFISANGGDVITSVSDGAGGAGAGGTIILQVQGIRVKNTCSLAISANGGNGGNVTSISTHGGGGGGGQGAIYTPLVLPVSNVHVESRNGVGGLSAIGPGAPQAQGGGGANNSGINPQVETPLPAVLLLFEALPEKEFIQINWRVSAEMNLKQYQLWRSSDGLSWESVFSQSAKNDAGVADYTYIDETKSLKLFYKLAIVEEDNRVSYSPMVSISRATTQFFRVYPNPVVSELYLDSDIPVSSLMLYSISGKFISAFPVEDHQVDLSGLTPGIFILEVKTSNGISRIPINKVD